VWSYNNKALNLLAALVKKASGQRLDGYLKKRLFSPMGITTSTWTLDPAGNAHGMSGLQIEPRDLAKLGQLMLQEGKWNGRQLLSAKWVELSSRASTSLRPNYGLLWWLVGARPNPVLVDDASLAAMRAGKVDPELIAKLEPLKGKEVHGDGEAAKLLMGALGGEAGFMRFRKEVLGRGFLPAPLSGPTGFEAQGYLGQYLVVYPAKKLVAVRMYRGPSDESAPTEASGFAGFEAAVDAVVR
jgi:CubicO group peptidase (beta-lactamase class C family)